MISISTSRTRCLLAASAFVALAGCPGGPGGPDAMGVTGVPAVHRANSDQCLAPPAGTACQASPYMMTSSSCRQTSECTAGLNGRCIQDPGGIRACGCAYDQCTSDSQCTQGGPCACHDSTYNLGGNTCVPGNCQVDADCGAGGFCSPSTDSDTASANNCGYLYGYYCHTSHDLCLSDSDCQDGGPAACTYIRDRGRWECLARHFCG